MEIKITKSYPYIHMRLAKIKNINNTAADTDAQNEILYTACRNVQKLWKMVQQTLKNNKHDTATIFLGIYLRRKKTGLH